MHLFGLLEETMDGHPGQDTETVRRKSWQNQDKATGLTCPVPGIGTGNGFPAELPVRFVLTTTIPGMSYLKFFGGACVLLGYFPRGDCQLPEPGSWEKRGK